MFFRTSVLSEWAERESTNCWQWFNTINTRTPHALNEMKWNEANDKYRYIIIFYDTNFSRIEVCLRVLFAFPFVKQHSGRNVSFLLPTDNFVAFIKDNLSNYYLNPKVLFPFTHRFGRLLTRQQKAPRETQVQIKMFLKCENSDEWHSANQVNIRKSNRLKRENRTEAMATE